MSARSSIQQALNELRAADQAMVTQLQELQNAGVWSGADADRYQTEWNDLVRDRIRAATQSLEKLSYTSFEQ